MSVTSNEASREVRGREISRFQCLVSASPVSRVVLARSKRLYLACWIVIFGLSELSSETVVAIENVNSELKPASSREKEICKFESLGAKSSENFVKESPSRTQKRTKMKTIWVIGGPGCGKGTQCDRMIAKYGLIHLSSGDLLREEVASGSARGASLQELMSKGLFVPTDVVLDLIKERMAAARAEGKAPGFLIDGYPRELDQGLQFEKDVCPVDLVIFFDVANETLKKRLLGRAAVSQRADDNEETIKKRIEIFNVKNGQIVEHYQDKVVRINAEGAVDDIFAEVTKALDPLLAS